MVAWDMAAIKKRGVSYRVTANAKGDRGYITGGIGGGDIKPKSWKLVRTEKCRRVQRAGATLFSALKKKGRGGVAKPLAKRPGKKELA